MSIFDRITAWLRSLTELLPFEVKGGVSIGQLITRFLNILIMHYGCPNSKRTERLQLKKRIFR